MQAGAVEEVMVLVFLRLPVEGRVKTRLAAGVGAAAACAIYRACAEHVVAEARRSGFAVQCYCSDEREIEGVREWLGSDGKATKRHSLYQRRLAAFQPRSSHAPRALVVQAVDVRAQIGPPDLGERMLAALQRACHAGVAKALVIGTDIPSLTGAILRQAAAALDAHDVVFGPAEDGGFYLLGVRAAPPPAMLRGTAWSTATVLSCTRNKAAACGLAVAPAGCMPTLLDLDTLQEAIASSTRPAGVQDVDAWLSAQSERGSGVGLASRLGDILLGTSPRSSANGSAVTSEGDNS